jgi:hypothetical protein
VAAVLRLSITPLKNKNNGVLVMYWLCPMNMVLIMLAVVCVSFVFSQLFYFVSCSSSCFSFEQCEVIEIINVI